LLIETAKTLKGSTRRLFIARTVAELGRDGQRLAQHELGWNRETLRKGTHQLKIGCPCEEGLHLFRRKPAEVRLPSLRDDIQQIVDRQSQTNPQFRNHRLYTCLTPGEVRRQLIAQKGDTDAELPCEEGIRQWLNRLGYYSVKVQKSLPQKKEPPQRLFSSS